MTVEMNDDLYQAAQRTMIAAGLKPKDTVAVLNKLQTEYSITPSVEGGMLTLRSNETLHSVGQVIESYKQKYPQDFVGGVGAVNFKSDLADDGDAKINFIKTNGLAAWSALPANEKSPAAQYVVGATIPHGGMSRAEYAKLSTAEKTELSGKIGHKGIEAIMARR